MIFISIDITYRDIRIIAIAAGLNGQNKSKAATKIYKYLLCMRPENLLQKHLKIKKISQIIVDMMHYI